MASDGYRKAADLATSSQQARKVGDSANGNGYRTSAEYAYRRATQLAG
jgi:hypothetical protein